MGISLVFCVIFQTRASMLNVANYHSSQTRVKADEERKVSERIKHLGSSSGEREC